MIFAMARQRANIVTCVSCARAPDGAHEHVTALTVSTPGGHTQHIKVHDAIAQLRQPLGERYLAHAPKTGDRTEIVLGACPICHEKPHMRLKDGGRIEDLTKCSSDGN